MIIFMIINENIRDEKDAENGGGCTYKATHISATTYHKLQTLELIKTNDNVFYSKVSYANDLIQIFINVIKT